MAKKKLILEARVNEYTGRDPNPNVPWTVEELGRTADAVREAGASGFHFHARKPDGAPDVAYDAVRAVVERVRSGSDIFIHPTLGMNAQTIDPEERLEPILRLVEDGLRPDVAPMDMGTGNIDRLTADGSGFATQENVYYNTTGTLMYFAERLREVGVKPYLQIWNIPFLRLSEAFYRMGLFDGPLWMSFGVSGGRPRALLGSSLAVRDPEIPVEWSVAGSTNLVELAPMVIEAGGHLSVGIGDYAYPELGYPTNEELIAQVAELVRRSGREIATPDEAREMLGIAPVAG